MTLKTELSKYKRWVLYHGYKIDTTSLIWFYNQRGRVKRYNGTYTILVGKVTYLIDDIADQFIEGAKA